MWDPLPIILCSTLVRSNWFAAWQMLTLQLHKQALWVQAIARVAALKRGLGSVYEAMPRDLQQTMLSSPARAALLQSLSVQVKVPGQPSRRPAAAGVPLS